MVLFPRTSRRVIAHFFGVVLACLRCIHITAQIACALKGEWTASALHGRRCLATAHDHADHHHDHHGQQTEHQHIGKGFAHAQRVGQPGQAQACGQAAQHGAPWLLGCSGRSRCRWSSTVLLRCILLPSLLGILSGSTRRFALSDVARLLAQR